jgi:WD40 repeat protein
MKHDGEVRSAEFSPDGTLVVTASDDTAARVWDARTGTALGKPIKHTHPVVSASFSPDGMRIVTACPEGSARVWIAKTGEPVTDTMPTCLTPAMRSYCGINVE